MEVTSAEQNLILLDTGCELDLSLNDLRIIVNCFRGIEYQMQIDDEAYLDRDGFALKSRLEKKYRDKLRQLDMISFSKMKAN